MAHQAKQTIIYDALLKQGIQRLVEFDEDFVCSLQYRNDQLIGAVQMYDGNCILYCITEGHLNSQ
jgi:hypothetical protein